MRSIVVLALLAAACTTRGLIGSEANLRQIDSAVSVGRGGKVDLLFMIDNSPSMDAMQQELRARFGDLLDGFSGGAHAAPIDLHVGVITSDYGAGATPGGGCDRAPGGQRGMLQTIGAFADASCRPPVGAPFIEYRVDGAGAVTSNLPPGQDLIATFTCMASVGAGGCGFEHQLEATYAALHGDAVASGFLRPEAGLTVVFLTNEDDGSAPPDATFYAPDADLNVAGAYDTFRQTRFGVWCGGMPIPYGDGSARAFANCAAAPNPTLDPALAFPVERYENFFSQPRGLGGLKDNPYDVALVAIAGDPQPFATTLVAKGTGLGRPPNPAYVPCGPQLSTQCYERVQHSCQNAMAPPFFADPAVRLSQVIDHAPVHAFSSICGADLNAPPDFSAAMSGVGALMAAQAQGGCFYQPPVHPHAPICRVTVGDAQPRSLDSCDTGEASCWRVVADPRCPAVRDPSTGQTEQLRLTLVGVDPAATAYATCTVYSQQ